MQNTIIAATVARKYHLADATPHTFPVDGPVHLTGGPCRGRTDPAAIIDRYLRDGTIFRSKLLWGRSYVCSSQGKLLVRRQWGLVQQMNYLRRGRGNFCHYCRKSHGSVER